MLKVEVDIFSGRPNPVWFVTDSDEAKQLLGVVAESREAVAKPDAGFTGLGYREVRLSLIGDDEPRQRNLAREFAVGSAAAANPKASVDLARRVLEGMLRPREVRLVQHELTPLNRTLFEFIAEQMERSLQRPPQPPGPPPPPSSPLRTTVHDAKCDKCEYEVSQYNPGFWNTAAVQPHNNCYNYARNWRTDTFAQPGRAHGAQTGTMKCANVTTAAMADGLKKRCDCLPISEWPRRLMALVIAPNQDYHWYREQRGGFWGHKPGQTAARNVDNNNALVVNPETAARGPYTDFCGYFYAGKSVVIN
ncbi:MAG TPA: hypothetical protein VJ276_06295 [Thermoanaerobaculia bacterium]|nr:hypothetical protein [Thermoanaerobaculia bacterium]